MPGGPRSKRLTKVDRQPTSVKLFSHSNNEIDRITEATGKPRSTIIRELVAEALTARRLNRLKRTVRNGPWSVHDPLTVGDVDNIPDTAQTFAEEILEQLEATRLAAIYAAEVAEISLGGLWRLARQSPDYKERSIEEFSRIMGKARREARERVAKALEVEPEQPPERYD